MQGLFQTILAVGITTALASCSDDPPPIPNASSQTSSQGSQGDDNSNGVRNGATDGFGQRPAESPQPSLDESVAEPNVDPNCGGKSVGGFCWYASQDGESCEQACSAHGGYNEATNTYAGASGSDENCLNVGKALFPGKANSVKSAGANTLHVGCSVYRIHFDLRGQMVRFTKPTVGNVPYEQGFRICACNK